MENDLIKGTYSILQNLNGCMSNYAESVGLPWNSGFQPGVILPVRGHVAISGDNLGPHDLGEGFY